MMTWTIDIETIPLPVNQREFATPTEDSIKYGNLKDPEKKKAKYESAIAEWADGPGCALKAELGQIACIGIKQDDIEATILNVNDAKSERQLLADFWKALKHLNINDRIIGHNIKAFDIPFILRRSMVHGIQSKSMELLKEDLWSYKPKIIIDTMQLWQMGDKQTYISLKHLCGAFGITAKDSPVEAEKFYEWWAKDPDICMEYCKGDVDDTYSVYKAMTDAEVC